MLHSGAIVGSTPLCRQFGRNLQASAGSFGLHRNSTTHTSPIDAHLHKGKRRSVSTSVPGSSADANKGAHAELHDLRASLDTFGPRGMLLVGFSEVDGAAVEAWLQQMEPGFAVSHCTAALLDATVQQAVTSDTAGQFRREPHAAVQEPLPRLVLLSGMAGDESVAIAEHWEHFTGTPLPVFATLVERMWQRQLREASLDIMKSYASSSRSQKGAADAAGLREQIRRKLEERKAQDGRRLIGRSAEPVIVEHERAGSGQEQQSMEEAAVSGMHSPADDVSVDQKAVFRQQLAAKTPLARRSRKEVHAKEVGHKKAGKKGFG